MKSPDSKDWGGEDEPYSDEPVSIPERPLDDDFDSETIKIVVRGLGTFGLIAAAVVTAHKRLHKRTEEE